MPKVWPPPEPKSTSSSASGITNRAPLSVVQFEQLKFVPLNDTTYGEFGHVPVMPLPPGHFRALLIVTVAVPVTATVVCAATLLHVESAGPGQALVVDWILTDTGITAAPVPEFVAPDGALSQVLSQTGGGGAAVVLLLTVTVALALEPPSQSIVPVPFASSRQQT